MTSAGEIRSADPFLGQVVDERYKVEALLGTGAVGSVYRARERANARKVALKIWNGAALNEQTKGRFLREAKALSTLRHPNIVDVQGYGTIESLPYVAMEFLDGRRLEDLLGSGHALETAVAFEVITQILQALAYAHGLGVVHRDLKPENVMLVKGDRDQLVVKLLDYGLAKFLSPDDDPVRGSLTMTGMIMGTPLYMAPEQAAGKSVDARVDVYAAGCMLFEFLSGRPPFAGESNAEIFRAHMQSDIPKLAELRRDVIVVPELQTLLETALAKRAEERFADAGQMLEALLKLPRPALKIPTQAPPALEHERREGGLLLNTEPPPHVMSASQRARRGDRWPLLAALITGACTAAALAYALLH
jgi:eukaryotic-like serine/threonine-protein kinase